ncbi:MAG: ABC transporter ATP-binding protein [Aeromicrobium sp.]|uniref:ABC transporter ATP-binding protein n=1 Tax=Aeromicrobium sp. TaxID=1871063 RepID=UPI0039E657D3
MSGSTDMNGLLRVENLTLAYGEGPDALHDISLSVGEGEILVIVGESGSGKSTLLRAVMGLLPDTARLRSGQVLFRGRLRLELGRDVAMIFQHPVQFMNPNRRIAAQFGDMLRVHGTSSRAGRDEVMRAALSRLRLEDPDRVLKAYPFELSGGMMQRVALAMVMSLEPPVLLADEPTSALDAVSQKHVADQLAQLNRDDGVSIVLVTHHVGLAYRLAHRIAVMHRGRIVEIGSAEQVVGDPRHPYTRQLVEWDVT